MKKSRKPVRPMSAMGCLAAIYAYVLAQESVGRVREGER